MPLAEILNFLAALCSLTGVILGIVNVRRIGHVAKLTNSMKDELVAATAKGEFAAGKIQGREDVRAEEKKKT